MRFPKQSGKKYDDPIAMKQDQTFAPAPAYVIKPEELLALNYLDDDCPRPHDAEWINRGTDQKLKSSTIEMLQRTLFRDMAPPSVVQLHRSAGLRVLFATESERNAFAAAFIQARKEASERSEHLVTTIFPDRETADEAVEALIDAGFSDSRISVMWRVSQVAENKLKWREGHSKMSVASAIAGSGVAGALLGMAVLFIPGIGPVAAAGAIAAAAPSVASLSGVIGATGGAIAHMLDDHDVEGIAANYFEQQIRRGKVFVSVDVDYDESLREKARSILKLAGGKSSTHF